MLLDLNFNLKDANEQDLPEGNAGKVLANFLLGQEKNIPHLKAYDWAMKLHKNESIEVDRSDVESLKIFIKDCQQLNVLAKAPISVKLNELKE